jgi:DNA-binding response OmpR family regulator
MTKPTTEIPNVLIVDDNKNYREAFRRNLLLQGYEVFEAEDSEEALLKLSEEQLDVVVTDLAMRHPTEGLDLIRQARSISPHLPIIMISAVGTFEEGAEASRLGARYVISKSKIDEELENLYGAIDKAYGEYRRSQEFAERIRELTERGEQDPAASAAELRQLIMARDTAESVKGEAFDALLALNAGEQAQNSLREIDRLRGDATSTRDLIEKAETKLREAIPDFDSLEQDTREALRSAEFLYIHGEEIEKGVDFSRSIGFSYCFAVENEAKSRLRKRLQKFFGDPKTSRLIDSLLEKSRRSVSLFFHQHLLRIMRDVSMDITIDNIFQTFQRIQEHGGKYKPDGLKALGIVLLCFGRTYKFRKFNEEMIVDNPLGIKGIDEDADVLHFASLLTALQHYRNPYIHPEISDMEKLSKIRDTTLECMAMILRLE